MEKKIIAKDQWVEKFVREQPFMAFGSMANSYGLANEGKGISIENFKKDMSELFKLAQEFTKQSLNSVEVGVEQKDVDDPDFY